MQPSKTLLIGIDWADAKHDFHLITPEGSSTSGVFKQDPKAIADVLQSWRNLCPGATLAVAIESCKGALINALLQHEDVCVYPVNPTALDHFRRSFGHAGAKSDPIDAMRLAQFLQQRIDELRPLRQDEPLTRELADLAETRRHFVEQRVALANELTALLKQYFPAVLQFKAAKPYAQFLIAFLIQYGSLEQAQAAGKTKLRNYFHGLGMKKKANDFAELLVSALPLTTEPTTLRCAQRKALVLAEQIKVLNKHISKYEKSLKQLLPTHPDYQWVASLPGPSVFTQARLIAAMGDDRSRYPDAKSLGSASGIAPVTKQSGGQKRVHFRWACPKFMKQTFHELAGLTRKKSLWSKVFYQQQLKNGKTDAMAKRALALKWQRIIRKCWETGQPYDEARYLERLKATGSPLYPLVQEAMGAVENLSKTTV
jgi:transposase